MKSILIVVVFCFAIPFCAYPQISLGVATGVNFPLGNFSSKEVDKDGAGMAETGINAEIFASIPIYKNLGLSASFRSQWNNFDTDPLQDYPTPISVPGTVTVNAEPWRSLLVLAGPYFELDLNQTFAVGITAQGGVAYSRFPNVEIINALSMGFVMSEHHNYSGGASSAFAFLTGAYIKMKVADRFSLRFSADYLKTTQDFDLELQSKLVLGNGDESEVVTHPTRAWEQDILGINAMVALSYSLK